MPCCVTCCAGADIPVVDTGEDAEGEEDGATATGSDEAGCAAIGAGGEDSAIAGEAGRVAELRPASKVVLKPGFVSALDAAAPPVAAGEETGAGVGAVAGDEVDAEPVGASSDSLVIGATAGNSVDFTAARRVVSSACVCGRAVCCAETDGTGAGVAGAAAIAAV
ncbi:MAG: hypothetical protein ACK5NN_09355 [Sphingomonadaceae bacterium]